LKPVSAQWELNNDNIKRIDRWTGYAILHNYCLYINTTPLAVFRYLIETLGCDVNARDNDENTPLHYPLDDFHPGFGVDGIINLTYLLNQRGANGNIENKKIHTLLHIACGKVHKFSLEIFQYLIETKGFDVNARDYRRSTTPVHNALLYFDPDDGGDINVLHYLLSQEGVNAESLSFVTNPLLHYGCFNINNLPIEV
jgi:ankyrin repeat protein